MDDQIPAAAQEQPQVIETQEQTMPVQPDIVAEKPIEPEQKATEQPPVDITKYLSDKEVRKQILNHPEFKTEIERTIAGTQGQRTRELWEKWESDRRRQEEEAATFSLPDDALGRQIKQQKVMQQWEQTALAQAYAKTGGAIFNIVQNNPDLDDQDKMALDPTKYKTFEDYFQTSTKVLAEKMAKKMLPNLVKVEAEAMVKDILAKQRNDGVSPAIMDSNKTVSFGSPADIYKAYNDGKFGSPADPHGREAMKRANVELAKFGETL